MALSGEAMLDAARDAARFFVGKGDIHHALVRLTERLDSAGIPFAIVGALAMAEHGYRRMTEDIDILLSAEGLADFKAKFVGRGYVERFPGSRGLRDTDTGVPIDIVVQGEYPGDGKPKPVAFPDPQSLAPAGTMKPLPLTNLIEIKLASGMTAPHRLRDLADVLELIRANGLAASFADKLDPYVRDKFAELWRSAQTGDDET